MLKLDHWADMIVAYIINQAKQNPNHLQESYWKDSFFICRSPYLNFSVISSFSISQEYVFTLLLKSGKYSWNPQIHFDMAIAASQ